VLTGTNFKSWKEHIQIVLGIMDLDLALRSDQPTALTDVSSPEEKREFERWERSNRISLMIMKRAIPKSFRGTMSEETTAKSFLAAIEKRFEKNEKAETSTLLANLVSMKYSGKGNIREYIMEMSHIASKLKALKLDLSDDLLVHLVLISLPAQYSQFKVSYNCQKEKWGLNELISHLVQEEEMMKRDRTESAHLASSSKDKSKKKRKTKEAASVPQQKRPKVQPKDQKEQADNVYNFCNKSGHMRNDCTEYCAWRVKFGTLLIFGLF